MTEDQIERAVERRVDALDSAYMAGRVSDRDYEARMGEISVWAAQAYKMSSKTELTPAGEQYVVPGCEHDRSRAKVRQLGLWD